MAFPVSRGGLFWSLSISAGYVFTKPYEERRSRSQYAIPNRCRSMSRRLRYQVAVSLDGFIAGPNGEADWIVMDPSIDFGALLKEFDTALMGRKTHEVVTAPGGSC